MRLRCWGARDRGRPQAGPRRRKGPLRSACVEGGWVNPSARCEDSGCMSSWPCTETRWIFILCLTQSLWPTNTMSKATAATNCMWSCLHGVVAHAARRAGAGRQLTRTRGQWTGSLRLCRSQGHPRRHPSAQRARLGTQSPTMQCLCCTYPLLVISVCCVASPTAQWSSRALQLT